MRLFKLPPWIVLKELPKWTCIYLVHICNFSQKPSKLLNFSLWVSTKHPSKNATRSHDMPRWNEYNQPALQKWWFFTGVGWFFEFIKNCWFWFFENFKIKESSTSSFSKKIQNPRTASSSYFRSLTRTRSFHERIESSLADYFEKHGYIAKSVLCIVLRTSRSMCLYGGW
jgi:hypothetical protein